MLKLIIDNTPIPVGDNFSLQLNYENPLFSEDKITMSYSYNFSLPITSVIQQLLKHANRMSNRKQAYELNVIIEHSGVVFVQGKLFLTKAGNNNLNCFVRGKEILFRNDLSETPLNVLQLENYKIEGANVFEKLEAWQSFMMQSLDEDVTEGKYKFPTIKGSYESPELNIIPPAAVSQEPEDWVDGHKPIIMFREKESSVNHFMDGEFSINPLHKNLNPSTDPRRWITTVSPCLRLDYIVQQVAKFAGYDIKTNDLKQIIEYLRMVVFSGYTLDENFVMMPGTSDEQFANVHGDEMNLSEFLPSTNMWETFRVLQQMFNILIFIDSGQLEIKLINEILDIQSVDFTKYVNPNIEKTFNDSQINGYKYFFDLDEIIVDFITKPSREFEEEEVFRNNVFGKEKEIGTAQFTDRPMSYFPIGNKGISLGDKSGRAIYYDLDYISINGPQSFSYSIPFPHALACYSELPMGWDNPFSIYSKVYRGRTSNYPFFAVTQYLGPIETKYKTQHEFDNDLPPTGTTIINASSSIDGMRNYDNLSGYPQLVWGERTLFPLERESVDPIDLEDVIDYQDTESKGLYNNFHKKYDEFIQDAIPIEKTLNLPPHKIKELSTFKNPKHRICSPEGDFEGFVQKFSVTLTKDRISPTKVTYLTKQYD
jgi:hypothetical protein